MESLTDSDLILVVSAIVFAIVGIGMVAIAIFERGYYRPHRRNTTPKQDRDVIP